MTMYTCIYIYIYKYKVILNSDPPYNVNGFYTTIYHTVYQYNLPFLFHFKETVNSNLSSYWEEDQLLKSFNSIPWREKKLIYCHNFKRKWYNNIHKWHSFGFILIFILKWNVHAQSLQTKLLSILSPLHANKIIKQCSHYLEEIHVFPFLFQ